MQPYPVTSANDDAERLAKNAMYIQRLREDDINSFNNLVNVFMSGRKVGKIPTSSTDIAATDRIGDFNYTATYFYIVVDNSGAAWRRIALGVW